jgi:hypothetical protein
MALDLKTVVVQQNNGSQIRLFDNTGDYDASNNLTGWGSPNPVRANITQITISITKGDIVFSQDYTRTDITNFLNPIIGITINSTDMLGAAYDVFEDGLYEIEIAITADSVLYYDNKYEYMLWQMWAEIRRLTLTMEVPIINYLESYNTSLLNSLFDDILYACQYGQVEKATEIYTFLRNVLDNETVLTELFKNFRNYD